MKFFVVPVLVAAVLQLGVRTRANSLAYRISAVGLPLVTTALLAVRTATLSETTFESLYQIARVHPIAYLVPIDYVAAALLAALLPEQYRGFSLVPLAIGYATFWVSFTCYANPGIQLQHPPASFLLAVFGQAIFPLLAVLGVLLPVYGRRQRRLGQTKP